MHLYLYLLCRVVDTPLTFRKFLYIMMNDPHTIVDGTYTLDQIILISGHTVPLSPTHRLTVLEDFTRYGVRVFFQFLQDTHERLFRQWVLDHLWSQKGPRPGLSLLLTRTCLKETTVMFWSTCLDQGLDNRFCPLSVSAKRTPLSDHLWFWLCGIWSVSHHSDLSPPSSGSLYRVSHWGFVSFISSPIFFLVSLRLVLSPVLWRTTLNFCVLVS